MQLAQPFVRLPYQFDVQQLQQELAQFQQSDWMEHPSGLVGNLAIPLISLNGGDNNDFSGRMTTTPHLQRCEYMQQVMGSFGEVLARSRLMRLNAGAEVSPHVDFNYHWYSRVRIHIPIVTNPDVIFYCGDQKVHMQAGECWLFDSWKLHNVINSGEQDRVHLVVDTAGSSRFWEMVRCMQKFGIEADNAELQSTIKSIAYQPKLSPKINTERYNVAPVMAPGEVDALVRELLQDVTNNELNDADIVEEYRRLLTGFAKDWRELWHLFAYQKDGWPHYQKLLDVTARQLRPNPRALVTASNNLGINPIIMQRILRAALNIEQMELFLNNDG